MPQAVSITTSDGIRIVCERSGPSGAPVLVFSNSLGVTRHMWRDQIVALSQIYDVIAYDARGHGESDAPEGAYSLDRLSLDVIEMLDKLGVERAHFCGLSLGGMTGQALAIRAPERLLSLTLAATSAYMGPPAAWQDRIATVLAVGMETIVEGVLQKWFAPAGLAAPDAIEKAHGWLLAANPTGYAGCSAAIRDMDMRKAIVAIPTPTLILAGQDDLATPPDHARQLHQAITGSQLTFFPGAHLLNIEQSDAFTTALLSFLKASDASWR